MRQWAVAEGIYRNFIHGCSRVYALRKVHSHVIGNAVKSLKNTQLMRFNARGKRHEREDHGEAKNATFRKDSGNPAKDFLLNFSVTWFLNPSLIPRFI